MCEDCNDMAGDAAVSQNKADAAAFMGALQHILSLPTLYEVPGQAKDVTKAQFSDAIELWGDTRSKEELQACLRGAMFVSRIMPTVVILFAICEQKRRENAAIFPNN